MAAIYAFLISNFIYRDMGPFKEKGPGGIMILWRSLSIFWHKDTKHSLFDQAS